MDSKAWIYAIAASGLVAGAVNRSETAEAAPQKKKENVECFGINTCKGSNGCGLGVAQAELAFQVYAKENRYIKTKELVKEGKKLGECAGSSDGSAAAGYLAWVDKKSKAECLKAGGFVYLKDKGGNLQIEDSSGIKTAADEPKKEKK